MPQPGGPGTLTLGQSTTVVGPITPAAGQGWEVEVENLSPWVLTVNLPGLSGISLAPGMGQLYQCTGGPATLTVTPSGTPIGGTYQVLTNWAQHPDTVPGTFPVVVAPSLAGGSQYTATTLVSDQVVNGNGSGNASLAISGITQTTRYLTVYWTSTSVIDTTAIITGNTTGIIYDTIVSNLETFGPIIAPQGGHFDTYVENTLDTAVTITLPQLAAGQSITVWVVGAPISPLAHISDGQIVPVYDYPAGAADTPVVSNTTVANTPVSLVPTPSAGTLYRVGTLSFYNVTGGAGILQVQGATSLKVYARLQMAAAPSTVPVPFDAQVSEGLSIQSSAVQMNVSTYYRTLTAV